MRINHTGEVCAQALYAAQALVARDPGVKARFAAAAREEEDHLAWTQARLDELASRPSLLNPAWYAGAFAIGVAAGLAGDRTNLGFVVETERQVEEHLTAHMEALPPRDAKSRAIVDLHARGRGAARRDGAGSRRPDAAVARARRDAPCGRRDARDRLPHLTARARQDAGGSDFFHSRSAPTRALRIASRDVRLRAHGRMLRPARVRRCA